MYSHLSCSSRGADVLEVPLDRDDHGGLRGSAVFSLSLTNATERQLEIVSVAPVSDEGLEVEYIGYSSCRRGCVGTGFWTPETEEQVERGLNGTLPVPVRSDRVEREGQPPPVELVFVLRVPAADGADALERGCLRLLGIDAELADGTSIPIASPSGPFVAAVRAPDRPAGYVDCELDS